MATSTKAIAITRELLDRYTKEVSASFASIVESYDVNGNPVITFSDGTPLAGEKVVIIRVKPIAWSAVDVLGLTSRVYTPHQADICTETNAAATPNVLTPVELLPILAELAKQGILINWYQTAATVVPSIDAGTGVMAGTLTASYGDLYWNASKAQ